MFELAFKAHIPVLGVHTDDVVNFALVLHQLTDLKVMQLTAEKQKLLGGIYWTSDPELITTDLYGRLLEGDHQVVVVNPPPGHLLIFDAGVLPTPQGLMEQYLKSTIPEIEEDHLNGLLLVLKGMSLKAASEVVMLTQARTGGTLPEEVRRTRSMVTPGVPGLYSVDTSLDFYEFPTKLKEWLDLNSAYFLDASTPAKLVPRGLLFDGHPGVGKGSGAKAVANHFGIPMYRLDIATTMNRYIGESEDRVRRSLQMVERESPCVLLIDEVEKVVNGKDESGVTDRILSQLLWWLQEHTSRVLTVMTTNDISVLPPELYREGRIDMVMKIPRLSQAEACKFAELVFKNLIGHPKAQHTLKLRAAIKSTSKDEFSHVEVANLVYTEVKKNHWLSS